MYGSLDAAQRWGEHYAQVWEAGGFSRGVASPCHFFHKGLQTYILVHGDDFFIVGRCQGRKYVLSLLRGAYELSKVVTLGPESSQSRTVSFLGRTLTLRQRGIEYEPDHQHVSRALKALGLTDAKGVATPGTDDVGGPKASQISELRTKAKWHDPPEEVREVSHWRRIEAVPECSSEIQFPRYGQARPLVLRERVDAEKWLHHVRRISLPSRELRGTQSNTRE